MTAATISNFIGVGIIGIGATLTMDLSASLLRRVFAMATPNYCLVGRWFCHMASGTFTHTSIAKADQKARECTVGWISHYLIGVIYAAVLVMFIPHDWLNQPTPLPAIILGLITLIFPFLIMQPAFGLGIAAAKTPNPSQARVRSVLAHLAFGIGLYLTALPVSYWLP